MKTPILCYVTERAALGAPDETARRAALIERIGRAARAGMDWIQLREKDLEGGPLVRLAREAIAVASANGSRARVLVNDRLDAAWAAGAAGVHLGENSLPVGEVARWKRQAGAGDFLVGASAHSVEAVQRAEADGADYVLFGPVFATPSKAAYGAPQGVARLGEACRSARIPVLAIGGIAEGNVAACLDAGAAGIAAIRLFQQAEDLGALVVRLREARP